MSSIRRDTENPSMTGAMWCSDRAIRSCRSRTITSRSGRYDPSGRFAKEEGVGVFNGDIGFVKAVDDYEQRIVVEFDDGRQTEYPYNQLEELEHAFAITIHKSQEVSIPWL